MAKKVTFTLSAEIVGQATSGLLLGEFNNWNYNDGINLKKLKDGSLTATANLESGKTYEYRYLLNDGRWVNDHSADHYVHKSGLQVENCVITVAGEVKETKATVLKASIESTVAPVVKKAKVSAKKAAVVKEKIDAQKTAAPKVSPTKPKPEDKKHGKI